MSENGFTEHKRVIMFRLDQQDKTLEDLKKIVILIREDMVGLKTKFRVGSWIAGLVGGGLMGFAIKLFG